MSDPETTQSESANVAVAPTRSSGRRPGEGFFDPDLWASLKGANDRRTYALGWLKLQTQAIAGVTRGMVVLGTDAVALREPLAVWPEGADSGDGTMLTTMLEMALAEGRGVASVRNGPVGSPQGGQGAVALPIVVNGERCGAVALALTPRSKADLRRALRDLEWGSAWLEVLVRRRILSANDRLIAVLTLVATCVHEARFQAAATAMVTELANALGCERVSVGFVHDRRCRLAAISHSASFSSRSNLAGAIEAAMAEATDQQAAVVYPAPGDTSADITAGRVAVRMTRAHATLARDHGAGAVCSVPFGNGTVLLGVLTLERAAEAPFDQATVDLCGHIAATVGPVLDVKRLEDRWLAAKAWDALTEQTRRLFGPAHTGRKLAVLAALALVGFLAVAEGDYRISSNAVLEGTVQRVIAAPMAGYVAEAYVRAGDIVTRGEVLCTLDDADLRVERVRWAGQRAQRWREHNEALAARELAKVRILAAQLEQADAQLALLDEQLTRTRIVAPFDGLVVSGDLSQSLGAPVERGEVLFEVAPLDTYRVVLEVDERDITAVREGQTGTLALASVPDDAHDFVIEKITPVSTAEGGVNFFRVEAGLGGDTRVLRPGMEGVGKIEVERRKLAWIWTHKLVHWIKLWLWSWWP